MKLDNLLFPFLVKALSQQFALLIGRLADGAGIVFDKIADAMNMIMLYDDTIVTGEKTTGRGANMNTVFFTNNKKWQNFTVVV